MMRCPSRSLFVRFPDFSSVTLAPFCGNAVSMARIFFPPTYRLLPIPRILIKYRIQYLFHLFHALFKVCCFIDHLIHHHL